MSLKDGNPASVLPSHSHAALSLDAEVSPEPLAENATELVRPEMPHKSGNMGPRNAFPQP